MDSATITKTIIETINTIFQNLFSSIDNNLYPILDKITFVNSDILQNSHLEKMLGTSTSNGILLISNSLLVAYLIYFATKYMLSNFTYSKIEAPQQFLLKLILCAICMNFSYFIINEIIDIFSNVSLAIRTLGEDLFNKNISFSELINTINSTISVESNTIDIFSLDGLIKGTLTLSLLNLVLSYSLRYIMIQLFVLIAPFAFLSLSLQNTSWFFKSWMKNLFALLFIQIIISFILLILFSIDYSSNNLISKFLYIGALYALIKANSFVKEFIGGISTSVSSNINNSFKSFMR